VHAGFWSSELPYVTVIALVLSALLLRARPAERSTYLNTLWLFLIGILGVLAGMGAGALGFDTAARVLDVFFRIVWSIALIRIAGFALFRLVLPKLGKSLPQIIEDLAIIVVYTVYGLSQMRALGVDLTGILATSAIITAVLAFAMQDTLGNVLGGLAIQLDNSVRVGDWIQVDSLSGRVTDIRWRSTTLETRDWATVVIPNSALMKTRFTILGRREGAPLQWRRGIRFMVDPAVPPARVIALVEEEMREIMIANVARAPTPNCVLAGFEHGNLAYELRYFLTSLLEDEVTDCRARAPVRLAAARRRPSRRGAAHGARGGQGRGARRNRAPARADAAPADAQVHRPAVAAVGRGARICRRSAAVRAVRARGHHHQAGQHRALALHHRLRRGGSALRAARAPAARHRQRARRPVLRRNGVAHRRVAQRDGGRAHRRRVLPA